MGSKKRAKKRAVVNKPGRKLHRKKAKAAKKKKAAKKIKQHIPKSKSRAKPVAALAASNQIGKENEIVESGVTVDPEDFPSDDFEDMEDDDDSEDVKPIGWSGDENEQF